jgi:hypothetical protein
MKGAKLQETFVSYGLLDDRIAVFSLFLPLHMKRIALNT